MNLEALSSYSTCIFEAEPGKFDVKNHEPCILVTSLSFHRLSSRLEIADQNRQSFTKTVAKYERASVISRVKSGIFIQTAKFGQRPYLFHNFKY